MTDASISYAQSDGVRIAYQVVGDGPIDLVLLPGFVSHLDLAWQEPHFARFLRGLAAFSRLIWFDKRGMGLSDPAPHEPSIEDRQADLAAVIEAVGADKPALLGVSEGAGTAALYAARNPARVRGLVLFSGYGYLMRDATHDQGWGEDFLRVYLDALEHLWASGEGIEFANPSLAGDASYRDWLGRYLRASASPAVAAQDMEACARLDVRPVLSEITTPTLVMHRADERWVSIDHGRELAAGIPDATFMEMAGVDHWPWIGDSDGVLIEVEAFLTDRRRSRRDRPAWGPEALTPREREVAHLAVQGLSAADIADRLSIGERTVETHIANAYLKLGVESRIELVRRAPELGL